MLVTTPHGLEASLIGFNLLEEVDYSSLFRTVDTVLSNKETYRCLLMSRDGQARLRMDALHSLLQTQSLPLGQPERQKVLKALLRLSRFSGVLPSTFYLSDVEDVQRMVELETPSTDIYQGVHQGQKVLLKRYRFCSGSLSQEDRAELLNREAIIWAHHQHSGVLPFIGVFQRDDSPYDSGLYLISPFLEHGTIVNYLKSHPNANRCLLMKDVFDAMAFLHANDIVHGDLKGANVLVSSSGRACIADLGFSRLTAAAVLTWTTVQSVATVGTVPWQAPELLEAHFVSSVFMPTAAADVYSLGCMAYEVFTNRMPFWDVLPGSSMRPFVILTEVVENDRRPTKPDTHSEAYSLCGLTGEIWTMVELSWLRDPVLRPSVLELAALPSFNNVVDSRPRA